MSRLEVTVVDHVLHFIFGVIIKFGYTTSKTKTSTDSEREHSCGFLTVALAVRVNLSDKRTIYIKCCLFQPIFCCNKFLLSCQPSLFECRNLQERLSLMMFAQSCCESRHHVACEHKEGPHNYTKTDALCIEWEENKKKIEIHKDKSRSGFYWP